MRRDVYFRAIEEQPAWLSVDTSSPAVPTIQKKRKYSGPEKGSDEAKKRMEGVRAAQWAKAGLVQGQ